MWVPHSWESFPVLTLTLCFQHAKLKLDHRELADPSGGLLGDDLTELRTADQINFLLTRVVRLLAQNRISRRRAAVLTYATACSSAASSRWTAKLPLAINALRSSGTRR